MCSQDDSKKTGILRFDIANEIVLNCCLKQQCFFSVLTSKNSKVIAKSKKLVNIFSWHENQQRINNIQNNIKLLGRHT